MNNKHNDNEGSIIRNDIYDMYYDIRNVRTMISITADPCAGFSPTT